jgi:hypothetical protein
MISRRTTRLIAEAYAREFQYTSTGGAYRQNKEVYVNRDAI